MIARVLALLCILFQTSSFAAVILQYHHVSETTPASTTISPSQFEAHLKYLQDNDFTVVPLSIIVEAIKTQQAIKDKTVAITFDDAYTDILTTAKPLLDKFGFPYTIFVNPGIIERYESRETSPYLSWAQLKSMSDEGVMMANHGFEHDSLARVPAGVSEEDWLLEQSKLLLQAEKILEEKTGQSWRYFAYPYGEYSPAIQAWVKQNDFVAFSQQSGAVGIVSDVTSIPRFPASQPYDKISSLRDKLNSLPMAITLSEQDAQTIFQHQESKQVTFKVETDDFYQSQLNCYISGLGKQKIDWLDDNTFSITFKKDLPVGRVRCNCTAASKSKPGRYYWYSKPWFVLKPDGTWFHL
ncbi:polysaccharide deacetylase family protein [Litorilituus lipolyticus]|uniref:DUF2334 domain-containing protein n=1 Tax=Litorilituus lipolyticus TaxID=2491017 RepID=A0A502KPF4_9GAMM|nr:polysaccharide deacetylase family protein [Litorilituus lipolyticus]TPH13366.1 DUF2334 domain-containing protein [Litorilituus lipolyticus]